MREKEVETSIGALEAWGRTIDFWVLICAVGVAILLFGQVVFSVARWLNDKKLTPLRAEQSRLHEVELAQLRVVAADAQKDAATANERAKASDLKIEQLRSDNLKQEVTLEKERSARLAMLDQLKPRDITRKQMATIVDAVRGHIGTVYLYPLADPEASRYLYAISETLKAAGVDAKLMLARDEKSGAPIFPDKFDVPVSIVGVTAYEFPDAGDDGFVNVLVHAFAEAGISVVGLRSEKPLPNVASPAIFIGRKPESFEQFPAYATPPELEKQLKENPPPWAPK
jgi:hypothetical protein